MPRSGKLPGKKGRGVDYYRIGVRQFEQQILPAGMGLGPTTVWSYGSVDHPETFNYPAFTIEASVAQAGARQVDQRAGEAERQLPAAPAAGRPDAPLGEPARWRPRPRRARHRPRARTGARCRSSPTSTAATASSRATATPRPGTCPRRATSRAATRGVGSQLPEVPGAGPGSARPGVDARQRRLPVRQRPARGDDVVPRPHARDDARSTSTRGRPGSTCCAAGPPTRSAGRCPGRRRRSATRRGASTSRSRSRSRTAPSPRTARSSTRTTAPSSRGSTRPSCRSRSCPSRPATARATSRRSGTRSSSATRWSSTARTWP